MRKKNCRRMPIANKKRTGNGDDDNATANNSLQWFPFFPYFFWFTFNLFGWKFSAPANLLNDKQSVVASSAHKWQKTERRRERTRETHFHSEENHQKKNEWLHARCVRDSRVARRIQRMRREGKTAQRQPETKNYTFGILFIIYTLIASDIQNVNEQFVNIYYVANAFDRPRLRLLYNPIHSLLL